MNPTRIGVYVNNDKERNVVKDIFKRNNVMDVHVYDGIVTGSPNKDAFNEIIKSGFMVDSSSLQLKTPGAFTKIYGKIFSGASYTIDKVLEKIRGPKTTLYILHLAGPLNSVQRKQLDDLKVYLVDVSGRNEYKTFLTVDQYSAIRVLSFVISVEVAKKTSKKKVPEVVPGGRGLKYDISVYREEDVSKVTDMLASYQVVPLETTKTALRVLMRAESSTELLDKLYHMPEVRTVEECKYASVFCNSGRAQMGLVDKLNNSEFQWTGEGQIVGVLDTGIDDTHADLVPAIAVKIAIPGGSIVDQNGHGTHVAGIIAGRGIKSKKKTIGVAMGSKLFVVGMSEGNTSRIILPLDYKKFLDPPIQGGAKILNMSWGYESRGEYDEGCIKVDEYAWQNPEVLLVVAVGNSGSCANNNYEYRTVNSPASAKNVITVGASTVECDRQCPNNKFTWDQMLPSKFSMLPASRENVCAPPVKPAALSSRGPTQAGCIKPDVLAPGTCIESTKSVIHLPDIFIDGCVVNNDSYAAASGSSMATPCVSGCAAILREFLQKKYDCFNPSAALLKAMLILSASFDNTYGNAARRKLTGYPDFDQGFGHINLRSVLPHSGAPTKRRLLFRDILSKSPDALASRMIPGDQIKSFYVTSVNILPGCRELKVALVWTDYPGTSVMNNLQLDVRTPNGMGYPGNYQHRYLKNDPLTPENDEKVIPFDKVNCVETVVLINPKPGVYGLRVTAQNTPKPNQGYALVVIGETDNTRV